jgi:chromosome partitioning protein
MPAPALGQQPAAHNARLEMRNVIAVMNTKGGVGKSTLVLAMSETLSAMFAKNVLVIDADAQASVSLMLLSAGSLNRLQLDGLTLVDLLVASVLNDHPVDWRRYVVGGVSDVGEARTVYLIASDMQLTLFEREVSRQKKQPALRSSVSSLLACMREMFDVVLIDCPPGISVVTESFLREADFYVSPANPDHMSAYSLEVLAHFKGLNPEMGFAENLGVLITMKDAHSPPDPDQERRLIEHAENRCFARGLPRSSALQHAGHFSLTERAYDTKYPEESGEAVRGVCEEILDRLALASGPQTSPLPGSVVPLQG